MLRGDKGKRGNSRRVIRGMKVNDIKVAKIEAKIRQRVAIKQERI